MWSTICLVGIIKSRRKNYNGSMLKFNKEKFDLAVGKCIYTREENNQCKQQNKYKNEEVRYIDDARRLVTEIKMLEVAQNICHQEGLLFFEALKRKK